MWKLEKGESEENPNTKSNVTRHKRVVIQRPIFLQELKQIYVDSLRKDLDGGIVWSSVHTKKEKQTIKFKKNKNV